MKKIYNVLDHGFVKYIDHMGEDAAIVQSARVSYGKGTKTVNEDNNLIRYLMRHKHMTPFEMCDLKVMIKCPLFVARQLFRHRTASINEYSLRYSEAIETTYKTDPNEWRTQSKTNKQGSEEYIDKKLQVENGESLGNYLTNKEDKFIKKSLDIYKERLEKGIAREQARKDLPLSLYTEFYWKCNLRNVLHMISLRNTDHAQYEIRVYAQAISEIVKQLWPITWEAFQEYVSKAILLHKKDIDIISSNDKIKKAIEFGWLNSEGKKTKRNRERSECEEKLKALNIKIPWSDEECLNDIKIEFENQGSTINFVNSENKVIRTFIGNNKRDVITKALKKLDEDIETNKIISSKLINILFELSGE